MSLSLFSPSPLSPGFALPGRLLISSFSPHALYFLSLRALSFRSRACLPFLSFPSLTFLSAHALPAQDGRPFLWPLSQLSLRPRVPRAPSLLWLTLFLSPLFRAWRPRYLLIFAFRTGS